MPQQDVTQTVMLIYLSSRVRHAQPSMALRIVKRALRQLMIEADRRRTLARDARWTLLSHVE
jgi:hypothetical protein